MQGTIKEEKGWLKPKKQVERRQHIETFISMHYVVPTPSETGWARYRGKGEYYRMEISIFDLQLNYGYR